ARYAVPQLSAEKLAPSPVHVKKPGNGLPGNAKAGNLLTWSPPDALPTGESPCHTNGHYPYPAARDEGTAPERASRSPVGDDLRDLANSSMALLGWVDEVSESVDFGNVDPAKLDQVAAVLPDAKLAE